MSPRSALAAGAEGLCVALVDEGVELRRAGIDAPILLLSEQPLAEVARIVEHRLTPTVYTRSVRRRVGRARRRRATGSMCTSRSTPACAAVGVAPADALALAEIVVRHATAAPAGRRGDPSGERRRPRRPGDRRPARRVRRRCSPTLPATPVTPRSTPPTRPARWPIRRRGTRSFERGSRSTGSRQGTASTISVASCAR